MTPVRLRLSRRRGYNLARYSAEVNGLPAKKCARPGPWGNPYRGDMAAMDFRRWATAPEQESYRAKARAELRGFNLACFCSPSVLCHVDVLLTIAALDK